MTTSPTVQSGAGEFVPLPWSPWSEYPLRSGTVTPLGVVETFSDTAYLISGTWVPFVKVHGPRRPASILTIWTAR